MSTQAQATTNDAIVNGVNVNAVLNMIGAIEDDGDKANFQFRANNHWVDGGLNRSVIKAYNAMGQEDATRTEPFVIDSDQPAVTAGNDTCPNPAELVLHSLAGCLTTTLVYHAAVQGIDIESIESDLQGDLDVRGMLGLSETSRKAYNAVRVQMRVKADADAETLEELALYSPVYDIVSSALPVEFELVKL